ncbi:GNAT family N-acetyltransferase [Jatrophihabitans sp.]|uniref:GNAT family N-acetyltransferase n=1 Tax=Jatrophihabitans sp. TaxID=1932789 RepID=UPI0030C713C6
MRPVDKPTTTPPHVVAWSGKQFAVRVNDAMGIYATAMGYPPHAAGQRAVTARRHTDNHGFASRAAVLDDGRLVGFGYGYTTTSGQWWHDLVKRALGRELAGQWLADAFELSELHVLPEYQGHGAGRELLLALAAAIPHSAMLLSTPDADTRAFRLYRSLGFQDLRRHYLFPGDSRPFAVLGARLPLTVVSA